MMIRILTGWLSAVCLLAVLDDACGQEVRMDRKAMVTGPREAMVNGVRDQPAPPVPEANRADAGNRVPVFSPYHSRFRHQYCGPFYDGYGYPTYYYSPYPYSYGRYGYGYGGPAFLPAGTLFGPSAAMRFIYGR